MVDDMKDIPYFAWIGSTLIPEWTIGISHRLSIASLTL